MPLSPAHLITAVQLVGRAPRLRGLAGGRHQLALLLLQDATGLEGLGGDHGGAGNLGHVLPVRWAHLFADCGLHNAVIGRFHPSWLEPPRGQLSWERGQLNNLVGLHSTTAREGESSRSFVHFPGWNERDRSCKLSLAKYLWSGGYAWIPAFLLLTGGRSESEMLLVFMKLLSVTRIPLVHVCPECHRLPLPIWLHPHTKHESGSPFGNPCLRNLS